MNTIAKVLAPLALLGTIVPPLLYAFKVMSDGPMKITMLLAAIVWFISAPYWLKGGNA